MAVEVEVERVCDDPGCPSGGVPLPLDQEHFYRKGNGFERICKKCKIRRGAERKRNLPPEVRQTYYSNRMVRLREEDEKGIRGPDGKTRLQRQRESWVKGSQRYAKRKRGQGADEQTG